MGKFLFVTVCALRQLFQNGFQERAFQGVVAFSDRGAQQITDGRDDSEQAMMMLIVALFCVFAAAS